MKVKSGFLIDNVVKAAAQQAALSCCAAADENFLTHWQNCSLLHPPESHLLRWQRISTMPPTTNHPPCATHRSKIHLTHHTQAVFTLLKYARSTCPRLSRMFSLLPPPEPPYCDTHDAPSHSAKSNPKSHSCSYFVVKDTGT